MVQRKALSTSTRHWTWCKGNHCRLLDIVPGATKSVVDEQRRGGGTHSIPGCKTIAACSWFLRMRSVTPSLPHKLSRRVHGYVFPLLIINIEKSDWTESCVRGRKTLFFFLTEELTRWFLHRAKYLYSECSQVLVTLYSDVAASLIRSNVYRATFGIICSILCLTCGWPCIVIQCG